jgi:DNA polymerase III subunit alpha
MIVHLRARSYYSFLDGLCSPAQLAQAAAGQGMPALGLADHSGLTGAVEFYETCRAFGLRPLLGLEVGLRLPASFSSSFPLPAHSSLVLLAMDLAGWSSLCRLSSLLLCASAGGQERWLEFEQLTSDSQGLICLTGGRRGPLAPLLLQGGKQVAGALLSQLKNAFPGRLYAELQMHTPADATWVNDLTRLARGEGLPLVATHSIHYLSPNQAHLQRLVSAIRLNRALESVEEDEVALPEAHFLTEAEMHRRFARLPSNLAAQAVQNTIEIAERCRLELPVGQPHYPAVEASSGQTPIQLLRQKAQTGAHHLYPHEDNDGNEKLQSRLTHELDVIERLGYAPLFLIMEEILQFARQAGVPFSSRGSAASSLVAHCLGITSPDPLRLNLYFERFLNPARATPPDIDTDLCSRRRPEVIDFVYRRFGAERVATVCTIHRYRRRSALRETAKAHGLSAKEVKALTDHLPYRGWGPRAIANPSPPFAELAQRYPSPRHQAIFRDADALLGIPRHLSVHPGGLVISPGPLNELIPTMLAPKGLVITQFDLDSIERLGLVKIDLLGIRGLSVLGDLAEVILYQIRSGWSVAEAEQALHFDPVHFSTAKSPVDVLDAIPGEDQATSALVETGGTIGCFQIESPGMRATLKEIHARTEEDIMVALALYRPGPLTGGLKDAFVRRHRGLEPVQHLHPALEQLLGDTYGVILYQEQVLRIAHELAGLSLADADLLRRAMSHFDPGKQMKTLQEKFVTGAQQRSGVPEAVSERVWELMAAFAGYGFPKAHAASYARIAWQAAWCKAHFPAEFMAAVLANWGGYYGQRVYLTEARRLGLTLRPPHINYARRQFSAQHQSGVPILYMGLDQVRDLTNRTQARILRQRPFDSLNDFLARADPRPTEAENLVRIGALSGLGAIPELLAQLSGSRWRGGQLPLFALSDESAQHSAGDDWPLAEKMAAQEVILGVSLEAHPLELYAGEIAQAGALTTLEATARIGEQVRVAGMRQIWRRFSSPKGEVNYFMSLEDLEGMLDAVIYSSVHRRYRSEFSGPGPYILEGMVERDESSGEPVLKVHRLWRLG